MSEYQWVTTAPHPWKRAHRDGWDQGQIGWKLHAVILHKTDRRLRALCGLRPAHAWGLDLFIEDKCKRCEKRMAKLEANSTANPSDGTRGER